MSVGIASLTGGIEITGALGLEGEASAQVDMSWSKEKGFAFKAQGKVEVSPKFTFELNLFARASLDLLISDISETWRHNLASYSWGPDMKFGIIFPINYKEGEPFDISFDDIEVIKPDIDIGATAIGLAQQIKNDVF